MRNAGINLLWHPGVSEETGAEVLEIFAGIESGAQKLDILCVEGSILRGPNGTGKFNRLSGTGRTLLDFVKTLAPLADYCVAVEAARPMAAFPPAIPTRPTPAACIMTARRRAARSAAIILRAKTCR